MGFSYLSTAKLLLSRQIGEADRSQGRHAECDTSALDMVLVTLSLSASERSYLRLRATDVTLLGASQALFRPYGLDLGLLPFRRAVKVHSELIFDRAL